MSVYCGDDTVADYVEAVSIPCWRTNWRQERWPRRRVEVEVVAAEQATDGEVGAVPSRA